MRRPRQRIDSVRASRDGHEYHEAWAARQALRLLLRLDDLVGIAVEGLEVEDQKSASTETVDIADLVFYYGRTANFSNARMVCITQAKYSISRASVAFRAHDAAKTIRKFAKAYRSHQKIYGVKAVRLKLEFAIVTNRPIAREFKLSLAGIVSSAKLKGHTAKQAKQFKTACGLTGKDLQEFTRKLQIIDSTGSLKETKQATANLICDWSGGRDAIARLRIGDLQSLMREKAGSDGQRRNLIRQTDVLAALGLQSEKDLLPFPPRFQKVGPIVPREQLQQTLKLIPTLAKPLLIHADGGTGKTVFLESLINSLSVNNICVVFDCFDGGVYRAPEDGRHRAARGLVQIVNTLACFGLCDPLLPLQDNQESLLATFRLRLGQAADTLKLRTKGQEIIVCIDAIDNAAMEARDRNDDPFPKLVLQSLEINGQIPNVKFIVTCRTHRRELAKGNVKCQEVALSSFSANESKKFIRDRLPKITDNELTVAHARSRGNPRVLARLIEDRGQLKQSEIGKSISLEQLIAERIRKAIEEAAVRGSKECEIDAFIAGLSILPPPVPVKDYADAHQIEVGAVQSFASDLSPLLELTKQGLMFRDEPTETYIRENHAAKPEILRLLADNLRKRQETSYYAAIALPGLLDILDDSKGLLDLALADELPNNVTSTVGKQKVRFARLRTAALHAARNKNYNNLVRLLVELSTVAALNQRGIDYLFNNPELVAITQDADAMHRMVEDRSLWPGSKFARLAIVATLSGDLADGLRNAVNSANWIEHFQQQEDRYRREMPGPTKLDTAAIPFCLIGLNRDRDACDFIGRYSEHNVFAISEDLFRLLGHGKLNKAFPDSNSKNFIASIKCNVGLLAGALAFGNNDESTRGKLVRKLARASVKRKIEVSLTRAYGQRKLYTLADGILKSSVISIFLGLRKEASVILNSISKVRPSNHVFMDRFAIGDAFPHVVRAVIESTVNCTELGFHALIPMELSEAAQSIPEGLKYKEFASRLREKHDEIQSKKAVALANKGQTVHRSHDEIVEFISHRLEDIHTLGNAFKSILEAVPERRDQAVLALLRTIASLTEQLNTYGLAQESSRFIAKLGSQILEFVIWFDGITGKSVLSDIIEHLYVDKATDTHALIRITAVVAQNTEWHDVAGALAIKVKQQLEIEDDVASRIEHLGGLGTAMSHTTPVEAKAYYAMGLQQMEAIGSGDYRFSNELLHFAGSLEGDELEPVDFHTLSNLSELNMRGGTDHHPWADVGRALARTSGCRGLAKLARWHDRGKAPMEYSLLPYLYALIEQSKIAPALALGLLRLTNPVDFYYLGSSHLAELIEKKGGTHRAALIEHLVSQFRRNNPLRGAGYIAGELAKVCERVFGADANIAKELKLDATQDDVVRAEQNTRGNHGSFPFTTDPNRNVRRADERSSSKTVETILRGIDVTDGLSISQAIESLRWDMNGFERKKEFIFKLQEKVKYADYAKYVEMLARLPNLELHIKVDALKVCKTSWCKSCQSLSFTFQTLYSSLFDLHFDDFVRDDYFSLSSFRDVASLCEAKPEDLVLELIKSLTKSSFVTPPPVWLELASLLLPKTDPGQGQAALKRLLRSDAAQLAAVVSDGPWQTGMYPEGDPVKIASSLTWFMMGSPSVIDRWHAAHSVRAFAKLDQWEVISSLVQCYSAEQGSSFHAPELPFFVNHARLWLLIALDRTSRDHPKQMSQFAPFLTDIAFAVAEPHILFRHFAVNSLLKLYDAGQIKLSRKVLNALKAVNRSPFPILKAQNTRVASIYHDLPRTEPEPTNRFGCELDFEKEEVAYVARLFNLPLWKVHDEISNWVRGIDKNVRSMYDAGGRKNNDREFNKGINSKSQLYGNQLGWHGLRSVAGKLLRSNPVMMGPYDTPNIWSEWIEREALTRRDGLWLSDGMVRAPLETRINLFGPNPQTKLTSDRSRMLSLLQIRSASFSKIVLCGSWSSSDGVSVSVSSALVHSGDAKTIALDMAKADGFGVWWPTKDNDAFGQKKKRYAVEYLHRPSTSAGIDEFDPLGSIALENRPQIAESIIKSMGLQSSDPFGSQWEQKKGRVCYSSEAWGSSLTNHEGQSDTGDRLVATGEFLSALLAKLKKDVLILILLRHYERNYQSSGEFWHTTALVHITRDLKFKFYPGLKSAKHSDRL